MGNGHFYFRRFTGTFIRVKPRLTLTNVTTPKYIYAPPWLILFKTDNSIDIRFGYFRDLDDGLVQSVFQSLDLLLQKFYR